MEDLIVKRTNKGDLYEVIPDQTLFIVYYEDGKKIGGGLENTGWDDIDKPIKYLQYALSTGKVITIPKYNKYLHLVEASMSIDKDKEKLYGKNYHYVYIKGYTGDKVITHKISLRSFDKDSVGEMQIYQDDINELNNYGNSWKVGM